MPRRRVLLAFAIVLVAALAFDRYRAWRSRGDEAAGGSSSRVHVLFLGNSFTFVNDLPGLVRALAEKDGVDVAYVMHARGGAPLEAHAKDGEVSELLTKKWDYVVLQEQSQIPSFAKAQRGGSERALVLLRDAAQAHGATPVLFTTWGYRDGDRANVPSDTYEGMQSRLDRTFAELAESDHVTLVPVASAWSEARRTHPAWDLWAADGHHPSLTGSYLAACVFYAKLVRHPATGNAFTAGLPAEVARGLQEIADRAVTR